MYAREIGALAGVDVPIVPMAHEYLITKPTGLPLEMPTMRDPSLLVYFRPESGGLIMGGYERHCAPWGLDGIPAEFNSRPLEEDWPRFEELMENAVVRVPSLSEMEVVKLINGPEAFTPDGEFILGPTDVRGFWVAAGFCAHGLAGAGGMGKLVAEWIVEGTPSLDVWHMDSRRFGLAYRSREYTLARTTEIYETYYDVKYPATSARPGGRCAISPAYARLAELGAAFGEKSGWERANWFEPNAARGDESLRPRAGPASSGRPRSAPSTSPAGGGRDLRRELVRQDRVGGRGAAELLERLCANRVARDVGRHLHPDAQPARRDRVRLHVTRLAEDRFRIVTGTAFGQHDLAWIRSTPRRRHGAGRGRDLALCVLRRLGPRARDILQPLTIADLSNEAFPYMQRAELAIGRVPCLACG
jgi:4-methylaminobutanoate oxidase (formaldehyde-forming)